MYNRRYSQSSRQYSDNVRPVPSSVASPEVTSSASQLQVPQPTSEYSWYCMGTRQVDNARINTLAGQSELNNRQQPCSESLLSHVRDSFNVNKNLNYTPITNNQQIDLQNTFGHKPHQSPHNIVSHSRPSVLSPHATFSRVKKPQDIFHSNSSDIGLIPPQASHTRVFQPQSVYLSTQTSHAISSDSTQFLSPVSGHCMKNRTVYEDTLPASCCRFGEPWSQYPHFHDDLTQNAKFGCMNPCEKQHIEPCDLKEKYSVNNVSNSKYLNKKCCSNTMDYGNQNCVVSENSHCSAIGCPLGPCCRLPGCDSSVYPEVRHRSSISQGGNVIINRGPMHVGGSIIINNHSADMNSTHPETLYNNCILQPSLNTNSIPKYSTCYNSDAGNGQYSTPMTTSFSGHTEKQYMNENTSLGMTRVPINSICQGLSDKIFRNAENSQVSHNSNINVNSFGAKDQSVSLVKCDSTYSHSSNAHDIQKQYISPKMEPTQRRSFDGGSIDAGVVSLDLDPIDASLSSVSGLVMQTMIKNPLRQSIEFSPSSEKEVTNIKDKHPLGSVALPMKDKAIQCHERSPGKRPPCNSSQSEPHSHRQSSLLRDLLKMCNDVSVAHNSDAPSDIIHCNSSRPSCTENTSESMVTSTTVCAKNKENWGIQEKMNKKGTEKTTKCSNHNCGIYCPHSDTRHDIASSGVSASASTRTEISNYQKSIKANVPNSSQKIYNESQRDDVDNYGYTYVIVDRNDRKELESDCTYNDKCLQSGVAKQMTSSALDTDNCIDEEPTFTYVLLSDNDASPEEPSKYKYVLLSDDDLMYTDEMWQGMNHQVTNMDVECQSLVEPNGIKSSSVTITNHVKNNYSEPSIGQSTKEPMVNAENSKIYKGTVITSTNMSKENELDNSLSVYNSDASTISAVEASSSSSSTILYSESSDTESDRSSESTEMCNDVRRSRRLFRNSKLDGAAKYSNPALATMYGHRNKKSVRKTSKRKYKSNSISLTVDYKHVSSDANNGADEKFEKFENLDNNQNNDNQYVTSAMQNFNIEGENACGQTANSFVTYSTQNNSLQSSTDSTTGEGIYLTSNNTFENICTLPRMTQIKDNNVSMNLNNHRHSRRLAIRKRPNYAEIVKNKVGYQKQSQHCSEMASEHENYVPNKYTDLATLNTKCFSDDGIEETDMTYHTILPQHATTVKAAETNCSMTHAAKNINREIDNFILQRQDRYKELESLSTSLNESIVLDTSANTFAGKLSSIYNEALHKLQNTSCDTDSNTELQDNETHGLSGSSDICNQVTKHNRKKCDVTDNAVVNTDHIETDHTYYRCRHQLGTSEGHETCRSLKQTDIRNWITPDKNLEKTNILFVQATELPMPVLSKANEEGQRNFSKVININQYHCENNMLLDSNMELEPSNSRECNHFEDADDINNETDTDSFYTACLLPNVYTSLPCESVIGGNLNKQNQSIENNLLAMEQSERETLTEQQSDLNILNKSIFPSEQIVKDALGSMHGKPLHNEVIETKEIDHSKNKPRGKHLLVESTEEQLNEMSCVSRAEITQILQARCREVSSNQIYYAKTHAKSVAHMDLGKTFEEQTMDENPTVASYVSSKMKSKYISEEMDCVKKNSCNETLLAQLVLKDCEELNESGNKVKIYGTEICKHDFESAFIDFVKQNRKSVKERTNTESNRRNKKVMKHQQRLEKYRSSNYQRSKNKQLALSALILSMGMKPPLQWLVESCTDDSSTESDSDENVTRRELARQLILESRNKDFQKKCVDDLEFEGGIMHIDDQTGVHRKMQDIGHNNARLSNEEKKNTDMDVDSSENEIQGENAKSIEMQNKQNRTEMINIETPGISKYLPEEHSYASYKQEENKNSVTEHFAKENSVEEQKTPPIKMKCTRSLKKQQNDATSKKIDKSNCPTTPVRQCPRRSCNSRQRISRILTVVQDNSMVKHGLKPSDDYVHNPRCRRQITKESFNKTGLRCSSSEKYRTRKKMKLVTEKAKRSWLASIQNHNRFHRAKNVENSDSELNRLNMRNCVTMLKDKSHNSNSKGNDYPLHHHKKITKITKMSTNELSRTYMTRGSSKLESKTRDSSSTQKVDTSVSSKGCLTLQGKSIQCSYCRKEFSKEQYRNMHLKCCVMYKASKNYKSGTCGSKLIVGKIKSTKLSHVLRNSKRNATCTKLKNISSGATNQQLQDKKDQGNDKIRRVEGPNNKQNSTVHKKQVPVNATRKLPVFRNKGVAPLRRANVQQTLGCPSMKSTKHKLCVRRSSPTCTSTSDPDRKTSTGKSNVKKLKTPEVSKNHRRYACSFCKYSASRKDCLDRHNSYHTTNTCSSRMCIPCDRLFSSLQAYRHWHSLNNLNHVSDLIVGPETLSLGIEDTNNDKYAHDGDNNEDLNVYLLKDASVVLERLPDFESENLMKNVKEIHVQKITEISGEESVIAIVQNSSSESEDELENVTRSQINSIDTAETENTCTGLRHANVIVEMENVHVKPETVEMKSENNVENTEQHDEHILKRSSSSYPIQCACCGHIVHSFQELNAHVVADHSLELESHKLESCNNNFTDYNSYAGINDVFPDNNDTPLDLSMNNIKTDEHHEGNCNSQFTTTSWTLGALDCGISDEKDSNNNTPSIDTDLKVEPDNDIEMHGWKTCDEKGKDLEPTDTNVDNGTGSNNRTTRSSCKENNNEQHVNTNTGSNNSNRTGTSQIGIIKKEPSEDDNENNNNPKRTDGISITKDAELLLCLICHTSFAVKADLLKHLVKVHKLTNLCQLCYFTDGEITKFANAVSLRNHKLRYHPQDMVLCVCGSLLIDQKMLLSHQKKFKCDENGNNEMVKCVCGKRFVNENILLAHQSKCRKRSSGMSEVHEKEDWNFDAPRKTRSRQNSLTSNNEDTFKDIKQTFDKYDDNTPSSSVSTTMTSRRSRTLKRKSSDVENNNIDVIKMEVCSDVVATPIGKGKTPSKKHKSLVKVEDIQNNNMTPKRLFGMDLSIKGTPISNTMTIQALRALNVNTNTNVDNGVDGSDVLNDGTKANVAGHMKVDRYAISATGMCMTNAGAASQVHVNESSVDPVVPVARKRGNKAIKPKKPVKKRRCPKPDAEGRYPCKVCRRRFKRPYLYVHQKLYHQKKQWILVPTAWTKPRKEENSEASHGRTYKCGWCKFVSVHWRTVIRHHYRSHQDLEFRVWPSSADHTSVNGPPADTRTDT